MTQKEALAIMMAGKDVFLTGAAGSGKTYLLRRFIEHLQAQNRGVGITASTGIAATHIGGRTIHSWAGIEIKEKISDKELRKLKRLERLQTQFAKTKVLIIDEISMLDSFRLDLVDKVCRAVLVPFLPFGGLQTIFCGDFFQLPPITRRAAEPIPFAWKSRAWQELAPTVCYLEEQHRQDDDGFLSVLNAIRQGRVDEGTKRLLESRLLDCPDWEITKLFTHNLDVDAMNNTELELLPGEEKTFRMQAYGPTPILANLKKSCLAPEQLRLKPGAKVMFVKNRYDQEARIEFVNGTMGLVLSFDKESGYPLVETRAGRVILLRPETWEIQDENNKTVAAVSQLPLRLAWAITVHKSQGMSLDEARIDLSRCFEYGMGYVALSRVRSLSGLFLAGLNARALEVHPEVALFESRLLSSS
jgi:ATP-dependent exoDNAse (exonuclease V) alpha subunit